MFQGEDYYISQMMKEVLRDFFQTLMKTETRSHTFPRQIKDPVISESCKRLHKSLHTNLRLMAHILHLSKT